MEKDEENGRTTAGDYAVLEGSQLPSTSEVGHASSTGELRRNMDEIWREIQDAKLHAQHGYGWRGSEFARIRKISPLQYSDSVEDTMAQGDEIMAGGKPVAIIIPTESEEKRLGRRPTIRNLPKKIKTETRDLSIGGESIESSSPAVNEAEDTSVGLTGDEQGHEDTHSGVTGIKDSPSITAHPAHPAQTQESSCVQDLEETASKGKTVEFQDGDPDFSPQDSTHHQDIGNVQQFSKLHVAPRGEGGTTPTAAEGNESPSGNNWNHDTPAWRRKLTKIVNICCFCNSTKFNSP